MKLFGFIHISKESIGLLQKIRVYTSIVVSLVLFITILVAVFAPKLNAGYDTWQAIANHVLILALLIESAMYKIVSYLASKK